MFVHLYLTVSFDHEIYKGQLMCSGHEWHDKIWPTTMREGMWTAWWGAGLAWAPWARSDLSWILRPGRVRIRCWADSAHYLSSNYTLSSPASATVRSVCYKTFHSSGALRHILTHLSPLMFNRTAQPKTTQHPVQLPSGTASVTLSDPTNLKTQALGAWICCGRWKWWNKFHYQLKVSSWWVNCVIVVWVVLVSLTLIVIMQSDCCNNVAWDWVKK